MLEESKKAVVQRIQKVCQGTGEELENCTVPQKVEVKIGHPAEQIVKMATEGGYDLVVLGTHGHSMLDDLLLGRVARGHEKMSHAGIDCSTQGIIIVKKQ